MPGDGRLSEKEEKRLAEKLAGWECQEQQTLFDDEETREHDEDNGSG